MAKLQHILGLCVGMASASHVFAFEFDRPGEGMGTSITPVGQVAWEQGLPNAQYQEYKVNGQQVRSTQLNADVLLRTGLTDNLEVQLGWDGPMWSQTKLNGQRFEDNGLGDMSIALKHAFDLDDEKLSFAIMAKALLATGQSGFSEEEDIYSLASAVSYELDDILTTSITMQYAWQDGDWTAAAIPALSYRLSERWSGFSEWIYRKTEGQDYQSRLGSGVLYAWNERVQLDASVGFDIDRGPKGYSTGLGFSMLF